MQYKIKIEGGFTGIQKEYNGERQLSEGELKSLLSAMESPKSRNQQLRDGLKYDIELQDEKGIFTAEFDEGNLPFEIREFIDRIVQSDKSP